MTLVWTPGWNGLTEPEAVSYVAAVEAADGQPLEFATAKAINDFVLGCKNDGIWNAIKASCILAGARTLAGALVPLAGTAPTNFNFVSGDYNRKTGLWPGSSNSTKYLDSNRNNNVDPQNSKHVSVYASSYLGAYEDPLLAASFIAGTGRTYIALGSATLINTANNTGNNGITVPSIATGFTGLNRSVSTSYTLRHAAVNYSTSANSDTPASTNVLLYRRPSANAWSGARLAFYSIGESLDLALLDNRVSTLIAQFGAVIP